MSPFIWINDKWHVEDAPEIGRQLELHFVGAHVRLTSARRGYKTRRVWVTWMPKSLPHAAVSGILFGRRFIAHVDLWKPEGTPCRKRR